MELSGVLLNKIDKRIKGRCTSDSVIVTSAICSSTELLVSGTFDLWEGPRSYVPVPPLRVELAHCINESNSFTL